MTTEQWDRYVHAEPVWGTVITLDIRGSRLDDTAVQDACHAAAQELHRIDAWLSPFRPTSVVSGLREGWITRAQAPGPVREVIAGCARATDLSRGAFDPWALPGGFDPCGYVKGWGADRAAEILLAIADARGHTDLASLADEAGVAFGTLRPRRSQGPAEPVSARRSLAAVALPPPAADGADAAHPLHGQTIVFTGTLAALRRQEAWA
ncbi:MAG: FAD:protein FMN transferase, partial [Actinomycetes bacterium]